MAPNSRAFSPDQLGPRTSACQALEPMQKA